MLQGAGLPLQIFKQSLFLLAIGFLVLFFTLHYFEMSFEAMICIAAMVAISADA